MEVEDDYVNYASFALSELQNAHAGINKVKFFLGIIPQTTRLEGATPYLAWAAVTGGRGLLQLEF